MTMTRVKESFTQLNEATNTTLGLHLDGHVCECRTRERLASLSRTQNAMEHPRVAETLIEIASSQI